MMESNIKSMSITKNHTRSLFLVSVIFVVALGLLLPLRLFSSEGSAIAPTCSMQLGEWQKVAPVPDHHLEGASAIVDGKLYLLTGFNEFTSTLFPTQKVDVYNPLTNIWESVANPRSPVPLAMSHVWAAVDGPYIWLVGGFVGPHPGVPTSEVWRYDTVADRWWQGPDLPAPRASGGVAIVGRQLHYMGGLSYDRQIVQADHWMLDLDTPEAWRTVASMPRARNHFQAVSVDGLIYAVAGQIGHDVFAYDVAWLDAYDPQTDSWTVKADLPQPRSHFETGTFAYDGRIFAVSGKSRPEYQEVSPFVTEYNPQTDSWTALRDLPLDLVGTFAAIIDNQFIFAGGGVNYNAFYDETWVSDVTDLCG